LCPLRYLWEINTTVASVILGATSLGILFYLLIVIAGSVFTSCPYQTPGSFILQSATSAFLSATLAIPSTVKHTFRAFGDAFRDSVTAGVFRSNAVYYRHWWSRGFLSDVLDELPPALASDGAHLWQAIIHHWWHLFIKCTPGCLVHLLL
jgi:hypothetical protein